jgi:hypothetical protein
MRYSSIHLDHLFAQANGTISFCESNLAGNLTENKRFYGGNQLKPQWDAVHSPGLVVNQEI